MCPLCHKALKEIIRFRTLQHSLDLLFYHLWFLQVTCFDKPVKFLVWGAAPEEV